MKAILARLIGIAALVWALLMLLLIAHNIAVEFHLRGLPHPVFDATVFDAFVTPGALALISFGLGVFLLRDMLRQPAARGILVTAAIFAVALGAIENPRDATHMRHFEQALWEIWSE